MSWYITALKKYAVFSGRARRKEYWMFSLINGAITFVLAFVLAVINPDAVGLAYVYVFATIIPEYAVTVRRIHDTNHSGWWVFVPIINLLFPFVDGTPGYNQFGPDPKIEEY